MFVYCMCVQFMCMLVYVDVVYASSVLCWLVYAILVYVSPAYGSSVYVYASVLYAQVFCSRSRFVFMVPGKDVGGFALAHSEKLKLDLEEKSSSWGVLRELQRAYGRAKRNARRTRGP